MAFRKQKQDIEATQRNHQLEEKRTTGFFNLVVLLATAAVAYTDRIILPDVSLGYLYVLPIALSALFNPRPLTIGLAFLCAILQDLLGPPEPIDIRIFRAAISLAGYLIVGFLVSLIVRQRNRLADEVRQQRDDYERDLTMAAQVQQRVLPKPPNFPGIELAAAMQTARLLGGDYYDFFQVSDHEIDLVIADVSGKGASASLLMPSLAVVLRLRAHELDGPAAVIKDLDQVLQQITNPATFVTIFYARFNPVLRTLVYACGGHNPPLLLRPKTNETILLDQAGPIVGILPDAHFTDVTINLQSGDILTLYTDGVTEQENETEEEFSLDRLKALLLSKETEPASTMVADVTEAVSTFAGSKEQSDDITLVIAKIL